jgi:hypothetical protein
MFGSLRITCSARKNTAFFLQGQDQSGNRDGPMVSCSLQWPKLTDAFKLSKATSYELWRNHFSFATRPANFFLWNRFEFYAV